MNDTTEKVLLVANTVIRRRSIVRPAELGRPAKTKAEDIRVGQSFEATQEETDQLTRGTNPAARRATLDEQARLKGGKPVEEKKGDGLDDMSVRELRELAKTRNVTLPAEANRKDEIIAELRKAPAA